MPDSPNDLVPRVAVLEQIAKDTREALGRIERRFDGVDVQIAKLGTELRGEIGGVRAETAKLGTELRAETAKLGTELRGGINSLRNEVASVRSIQWTTFLWLLALLIGSFGSLLGVMAKGFRWL